MGLFGKSPFAKWREESEKWHEEFAKWREESNLRLAESERETRAMQAEYRRQLEQAALLLDAQQENAQRTSVLLDRCEELIGRIDALLSKWDSRDRA